MTQPQRVHKRTILAQLASELNTDPDTLRTMITAKDEALQPNYFTVNADGSIAAVFPGGVIIPELVPQVTLDEDKQISWVRNTDNALVAQVKSATFAGSEELDVFTQNPDDNSIQAGFVAISANAISGGSQTYAFVSDDAPRSELRHIINADAKSDFPQLRTTQSLILDGPFDTGLFALAAGGASSVNRVAAPAGYTMKGAWIHDVGLTVHAQVSCRCNNGPPPFIQFWNFGVAQNAQVQYYNLLSKP